MKCILIDDETDCLELLAMLIQKYCPNLQILGQYNQPQAGITAIQTQLPELVFLDVEMPEINGFGVLEACREIPFQVIFTTAFNAYAVQAFKYSAIGYLLKPVDQEDLSDAVGRAERLLFEPTYKLQRDLLFDLLQSTRPQQEKIALPTTNSIVFIDIQDIVSCEAYGNYTKVYTRNQQSPTTVNRLLKELEHILPGNSFYRLHNSYLINLRLVREFVKGDQDVVVMSDGKKIPVARPKKETLLLLLSKI